MGAHKIPLDDRLWGSALIPPDVLTGCWVWQRAKLRGGYGGIKIDKKMTRAPRAAYREFYGVEPGALCVLHKCDNPPCINPAHLFLGTHKDNADDRAAKGRTASGDRSGSRTRPERLRRGDNHPRRLNPSGWPSGDAHWTRQHPERLRYGQDHHSAKLTDAQIEQLLAAYASGALTQREAGRLFGISQAYVSRLFKAGRGKK